MPPRSNITEQNETQKDTKNPFLNILNTFTPQRSTNSKTHEERQINRPVVSFRNKFQNVVIVDKTIEDCYQWLSKLDLSRSNANNTLQEHPDPDMQAYIDSLKDTIVVKTLDSTFQRPSVLASTVTRSAGINFKKFKKVYLYIYIT